MKQKAIEVLKGYIEFEEDLAKVWRRHNLESKEINPHIEAIAAVEYAIEIVEGDQ